MRKQDKRKRRRRERERERERESERRRKLETDNKLSKVADTSEDRNSRQEFKKTHGSNLLSPSFADLPCTLWPFAWGPFTTVFESTLFDELLS